MSLISPLVLHVCLYPLNHICLSFLLHLSILSIFKYICLTIHIYYLLLSICFLSSYGHHAIYITISSYPYLSISLFYLSIAYSNTPMPSYLYLSFYPHPPSCKCLSSSSHPCVGGCNLSPNACRVEWRRRCASGAGEKLVQKKNGKSNFMA